MEEFFSADMALEKLVSGNKKYVSNSKYSADISWELLRSFAVNGQAPFATVITCSDSRVVPEMIFSAQIGDLFVIRVAGNVIDSHQLGSIEYACDHLGTKLVVVLGHERCGAVGAAIHHKSGGYIKSITDEIKLAIGSETDEYLAAGLNARHSAKVIENAVKNDTKLKNIKVVSAIYSLENGKVEFL